MASIDLPYVEKFRDRHGRMRYYFRRAGKRFPLPAPNEPDFNEAYSNLIGAHGREAGGGRKAFGQGTLAWVIAQYMAADQFRLIKPSTQRLYQRYFDHLREKYGHATFATLKERHVRAIRNEMRDRPSIADKTVKKIGMLWRFAKEHLNMDLGANPALEIAKIHTHSEPHRAWPLELCTAFEGIKNSRLVTFYLLARYSGQRRGDVIKMAWNNFDGSAIEVVQEKTGTCVWIPAHPRLSQHLNTLDRTSPFILTSERGTPYRATSITNQVCSACKELGFPGHSPHGLRHLAGSSLAEAGCTPHEIMSVLGHVTEREALDYVKQANRKVMARSAMDKWGKASVAKTETS
jgi:integrase